MTVVAGAGGQAGGVRVIAVAGVDVADARELGDDVVAAEGADVVVSVAGGDGVVAVAGVDEISTG